MALKIPIVEVHPSSIRYLAKGHPWITLDKFSENFPKDAPFIEVHNRDAKYILMNDPSHNKVRARFWRALPVKEHWSQRWFDKELEERLHISFAARKDLLKENERENIYLAFGEGDGVPGLQILRLNNVCLIMFQSQWWERHIGLIKSITKKWVFENDPHNKRNAPQMVVQKRINSKDVSILGKAPRPFTIEEFGLKYNIIIGKHYDFGIYTDMSAIRKQIIPLLKKPQNVLNLFCYTGAYSLMPIKEYGSRVTSVDLSHEYLEWLKENMALNAIDPQEHEFICANALKTLKKLQQTEKKYDLIICDPPSSFSDGKKLHRSIKFYEDQLAGLSQLLSETGQLLIFLNTHSITKRKYKEIIEKTLNKLDVKFEVQKELHLLGDCPANAAFHEGNYLKGLLLQRKS